MKFVISIILLSFYNFERNEAFYEKYYTMTLYKAGRYKTSGPQFTFTPEDAFRIKKDSWKLENNVESGYEYKLFTAEGGFTRVYELCDLLSIAKNGEATLLQIGYLKMLGLENATCPLRKGTEYVLPGVITIGPIKKDSTEDKRNSASILPPKKIELVYTHGSGKKSPINKKSKHYSVLSVPIEVN